MNFIIENIGWLLIISTIAFFFFYKLFSKDPYALTSKYIIEKEISFNSEKLPKKILDSLKKSGFNKVGYDPDENKFYAQTKISLWSWTEFIMIQIQKDNSNTKMIFTSICALPLQIIDWGKNKRNARKFFKYFEENN